MGGAEGAGVWTLYLWQLQHKLGCSRSWLMHVDVGSCTVHRTWLMAVGVKSVASGPRTS